MEIEEILLQEPGTKRLVEQRGTIITDDHCLLNVFFISFNQLIPFIISLILVLTTDTGTRPGNDIDSHPITNNQTDISHVAPHD